MYPLWVKSGLMQCSRRFPLRANSGHSALFTRSARRRAAGGDPRRDSRI